MAELLPSGIKIPAGTDLVTRANYIENLAAMDALVNEGGHDHSGVPGKGEKLTAGNILIEDSGDHFVSGDVELALQEVGEGIENHEDRILEIEGQVNVPDFNTTGLNYATKAVTVLDAYAGPADVVLGGASLQNLVVNGDFSNGTTGWSSGSVTGFTVVGGVAEFTATAQYAYIQRLLTNLNKYAGRRVFFRAKVKTNAAIVTLALNDGFSETQAVCPSDNVFSYVYGLRDVSASATALSIQIYDNKASGWTKIYADEFMAIPITGTPYEGNTAAEINKLVNAYFEGLQGAKNAVVGSSGKNLFPTLINEIFGNINQPKVTRGFKPNTEYTLKATGRYQNGFGCFLRFEYTDGTQSLAGFTTVDSTQVLVSATGKTVKLAEIYANISGANNTAVIYRDSVTLNEGLAAIPYEPYEGAQVKVSATRHRLPDLTEDDLKLINGKWQFDKRMQSYSLQSADITGITTTGANCDLVYVNRGALTGIYAQIAGPTPLRMIIPDFKANPSEVTWDSAAYRYTYFDTASMSGSLILIVPKGTFADLAAARAALIGTTFIYKLAIPIVVEEQDFAMYGITVEGSLSSNLDHTEFFIDDHDIMADVDISYSTDISKAVEQIKGSIDGLHDRIDNLGNGQWVAPTLLNGWVNAGGANSPAKFYKNEIGIVQVEGMISGGTTTSSTPLFILPVGYRPKYDKYFTVSSNNLHATLWVAADGTVRTSNSVSAAWLSLDGISFRVEA